MDSYSDIIVEVLRLRGLKILKSPRLFCACVSDMSETRWHRENQLLSKNCDHRVLGCYERAIDGGGPSIDVAIHQAALLFRDECGLSRENALLLSQSIGEAIRVFTIQNGFEQEELPSAFDSTDEQDVEEQSRDAIGEVAIASPYPDFPFLREGRAAIEWDTSDYDPAEDLAYSCFIGENSEPDYRLAMEHATATKGIRSKAQYVLGMLYSYGAGCRQSCEQARMAFCSVSKASELYPAAIYELAHMFCWDLDDEMTDEDLDAVAPALRFSAEHGVADAFYDLGCGYITTENASMALTCFEEGALAGSAKCIAALVQGYQSAIGDCLGIDLGATNQGFEEGLLCDSNESELFRWASLGADTCILANIALARCYLHGWGVERSAATAEDLLKQAADNKDAYRRIGYPYDGFDGYYEYSFVTCRVAASPEYWLAEYYFNDLGGDGFEVSTAKAISVLEKLIADAENNPREWWRYKNVNPLADTASGALGKIMATRKSDSEKALSLLLQGISEGTTWPRYARINRGTRDLIIMLSLNPEVDASYDDISDLIRYQETWGSIKSELSAAMAKFFEGYMRKNGLFRTMYGEIEASRFVQDRRLEQEGLSELKQLLPEQDFEAFKKAPFKSYWIVDRPYYQ